MFSKVAILFAILAAANATALLGAPLAYTGSSVSSRHQDAHGNYAFGYTVNDGHASRKSQSEVGTGGHKASAYNSYINHVAPTVAVGHAAPLAVAAPALAVGHAAPLAVAAPIAYGAGYGAAYGAGYGAAYGAGYGAAYGAGYGAAYGAPVAYSSAINHVAAAPVVAGHGLLGAGALAYGNGIVGHGLLGH